MKVQVYPRIVLDRITLLLIAVLAMLVSGNDAIVTAQTRSEVRLVLQITIDGLRADLLTRYGNGFGEGGFRFLMDKGAYYTNAHFQHANTETIVGHATLATGTFPSQHGMVGNVWFDRDADELADNIEDPNSPIIPTREHESQGEQVDPAQKKSRTQGRSPAVILAPTFGDGLWRHTAAADQRYSACPARTAAPYPWPVMRAKPFGIPPTPVTLSPAPITTTPIRIG